jgi:hypothetical protein
MFLRRASLLALVLTLLLAGCAGAQSGAPTRQAAATSPAAAPSPSAATEPAETPPLKLCAAPDIPPPAIASKPGYAQFWVTVGDSSGQPLARLAANSFEVSASGRSLPIEFFREDRGDAPTSLVVLFDASASMMDKTDVDEPAVLLKVRNDVASVVHAFNACDEAGELLIGGINQADFPVRYRVKSVSAALPPATAALLREQADHESKIRFLQPFTTDHDLALQRIIYFEPYGETPLYDGVLDAIDLLARAHYPNRALLVISDGIDNASAITRKEALSALAASGMPLYLIAMGDPAVPRGETLIAGSREMRRGDSERVDVETVKALAAAGGGHLLPAAAIESDAGASFVAALWAAQKTIGHGYQVGIMAPPGAAVTIAVNGHPDAIVRAERVTPPNAEGS